MKKLFDSGELGPGEDDLVLPRFPFWPATTRKSTPADTNNFLFWKKTLKELGILTGLNRSQPGSLYKPKTISVAYSEDKSDAKIFCIPDFETIQQLAPDIQLEMPRHSQLGNAVRDLVANNSGTSVSYGDQSFPR